MRKLLPMKLQFFAEPGEPGKGDPPPADPAQSGQGEQLRRSHKLTMKKLRS